MPKGIPKNKLEKLIPQPKKFILNRERATLVLKEKEPEPIRSLFFKDEFRKERDKDTRYLGEYNL